MKTLTTAAAVQTITESLQNKSTALQFRDCFYPLQLTSAATQNFHSQSALVGCPEFLSVCTCEFPQYGCLRAHPNFSTKISDFKNVCCCVLHRLLLRFPQWTAPPKFASIKPPNFLRAPTKFLTFQNEFWWGIYTGFSTINSGADLKKIFLFLFFIFKFEFEI